MVSKKGGEAEKIAKAIMATLGPITPGESDNITVNTGLYEVYATKGICVYIEVGFHDNKEEAKWIIEHTQDIAVAIAKGLCNHYGVKYVAEQQPAENPVAAKKIYRVFDAAGKQVGAYNVEANAFNEAKKQLQKGGSAKITLSDK